MPKHVLKLGRNRWAFYDPVTKIHLVHLVSPQVEIPGDLPESPYIRAAIKSGGLIHEVVEDKPVQQVVNQPEVKTEEPAPQAHSEEAPSPQEPVEQVTEKPAKLKKKGR